jgi:outer membrane protein TolC
MKSTVALGLAALALALPLRADDAPLTLARAIDLVLSRHPSLDAAQAAVDGARGRTEQNGADRLPHVSAEASYLHLSLRPYVNFGPGTFYPAIYDSYSSAVTVRQVLADFGRTDALVDLARAGEISAQDALDGVRSQLGYQTIQAFYGVILLRDSVGVADEEIRALEEAGRISAQKFSGGSATRFDVLTTQVRLATARNHRTDTLAALQKQEAQLRELLGYAPGAALPLDGDFTAVGTAPDLSATIAEGLRNRPEIRLARDSAEMSRRQLGVADRADRPTLAAQVSGGLEDAQLPAMYDNRGYWTGGVSVSIPIFTGGRTTGERITARADLRASDARVRQLADTIVTDVQDALSDWTAAQARLANADALVDQAQEALALARTRYANGVVTNFELLDAQSAARAAEQARLQARFDSVLARQAIARAAGRPPAP